MLNNEDGPLHKKMKGAEDHKKMEDAIEDRKKTEDAEMAGGRGS